MGKAIFFSKLSGIALGTTVAVASCHKDEGSKSEPQRQAPAAANVVPAGFRSTTDEAGFRRKLQETPEILSSSTSRLALRGNSSKSSARVSLAGLALHGLGQKLQLPARSIKALVAASKPVGATYEDDSSSDPLSALDLKAGDDCTELLSQLGSGYQQLADSYSSAVRELANTPFADVKGFSLDSPQGPEEAFAYKVALSSADLATSGSAADASALGDGKFHVNGRFAGGASDDAVVLKAGGKLNFASKALHADVITDLNTFANVPAKEINLGLGLDLAMTGEDEGGNPMSVGAKLSLASTLTGGDKPAQTFDLSGSASNGQDNFEAKLNLSLARMNESAMRLSIAGSVDANGSQGKQHQDLKQTVNMTIAQDRFGSETCNVASVTH